MSEEKIVVETMVVGGKATAGPPLGPALGPTGVNLGQVVKKINELTKQFEGLKVPVKVIVDKKTKEFEIEVGLPPTSALFLVELKKEKGSSKPDEEFIGSLSMEQIVKIAKMKLPSMNTVYLKSAVLTVLGTAVSMGIKVEGKLAKEIQKEVKEGKWDDLIKKYESES
ncbi:MAG: 50S ribosomal protein L11 [Candidatus Asgardarchaeia archaeon]